MDCLSGFQNNEWNDHFLQGNPPVLEGVSVITYIVIIVVRVRKKQVVFGKYVGAAHRDAG